MAFMFLKFFEEVYLLTHIILAVDRFLRGSIVFGFE